MNSRAVAERTMTRCECARAAFEEVAGVAGRQGIVDRERLVRRTGGGGTCTACLPDLDRFLRERKLRLPVSAP